MTVSRLELIRAMGPLRISKRSPNSLLIGSGLGQTSICVDAAWLQTAPQSARCAKPCHSSSTSSRSSATEICATGDSMCRLSFGSLNGSCCPLTNDQVTWLQHGVGTAVTCTMLRSLFAATAVELGLSATHQLLTDASHEVGAFPQRRRKVIPHERIGPLLSAHPAYRLR